MSQQAAEYAWPWNRPRPALGGEAIASSPQTLYYLTPAGQRHSLPLATLFHQDEKPDRERLARRRLNALPNDVRYGLARQLAHRERQGRPPLAAGYSIPSPAIFLPALITLTRAICRKVRCQRLCCRCAIR